MGKKLYTKENISKAETERLGIPELVVLKTNSDNVGLEVVHRRYFEDEKLHCPACRSSKTRCSKIVDRKLKDLLWLDEDHKTFQIISLLYHQRYMRCDNCGQSVFPEPTEFGEKGCKFTNRLSDALADGTFQFSYKKVCQHYGVPASTASVGEVMRRRIQYRESLLPPVRTPHIISIVEVVFFGEFYPAVLGIWDGEVYCLDILRDSSEETCGAFLKTLDANQVETIYVDPVDSLFNAVNQYFPMASIVVTDEAIQRYARNAMLDIIHSDGKRFPVVHKDRRLTVLHKDLDDRTVVSRIKEVLRTSYSVLQDDFFNYMKAAGYTDVERGERGSTEEHLTVTQFKVAQEQQRLEDVTAQIAQTEQALDTAQAAVEKKQKELQSLQRQTKEQRTAALTVQEIRSMGKKTITGNITLTPSECSTLKDYAVNGILAKAENSRLEEKLQQAQKSATVWKQRYESLKEQARPYLEAVKLAPEKVRAFLDAILTRTQQTKQHDQPSRRKSHDMEL